MFDLKELLQFGPLRDFLQNPGRAAPGVLRGALSGIQSRLGLSSDEGVETRPVTGTERIWIAQNRIQQFFCIQMVIEGEVQGSAKLDLDRFKDALQRATRAQPGARLRLHGSFENLVWKTDGPPPRLRVVPAEAWNGTDSDRAPFLFKKLNEAKGPGTEIVIVEGDPTRIVIRTSHAQMDGAATILFAKGLFAALRGEEPLRATAGPPTDADIGERYRHITPDRHDNDSPSLVGPPRGKSDRNHWFRLSVDGPVANPVSQVCLALAHSVPPEVDPRSLRFGIPVDMRAMAKCGPSSANLAGMVRLELKQALDADDPVAKLQQQLVGKLFNGSFGAGLSQVQAIKSVPMPLLTLGMRVVKRAMLTKDHFRVSALVSHLGRMNLNDFSTEDFHAHKVFFIPPPMASIPLFVVLSETGQTLEICASAPEAFASDGRLKALLEAVAQRLGRKSSVAH